jgi:hypothetical protein
MRVPFHGFFERLFAGDTALVWKMLGGGFVTAAVVLVKVLGASRRGDLPFNDTPANVALLGSGAAVLGASFVLAFSMRDEARRREERGEPVGLFLRVLGSSGCLWTFVGLVGIVLTIIIIGISDSMRG